jgi:hypothetical protein
MKAKTINAILCKKFDNFLESIEDSAVKEVLNKNSIITGGSIVSMLLNQNVNDYDIYLRTEEAALAVAKYYVDQFKKNPPTTFKGSNGANVVEITVESKPRVRIKIKSAGIAGEQGADNYQYFEQIPDAETAGSEAEEFVSRATGHATALDEEPAAKLEKEEGKKYRPVFITDNAITLSNKIQIVIRFYGEVEEIHKNYDFCHCTCAWSSWDRKLTLRQDALESILAKELRYMGSLYPICSVIRTRKFLAQGWTINAGQYLKMCWQISKLDLTDINVLIDQLVGVDAAYWGHVIEALRKTDLKTVDSTYIATIIDKIF